MFHEFNASGVAPLDLVMGRLQGVKRVGDGYRAKAPCHGSRGLSLSIKEGRDGQVVLHCFAGCSLEQIVSSLGLALSELFPPRRNEHGPRRPLAPAPAPSTLREALEQAQAALERRADTITVGDRNTARAAAIRAFTLVQGARQLAADLLVFQTARDYQIVSAEGPGPHVNDPLWVSYYEYALSRVTSAAGRVTATLRDRCDAEDLAGSWIRSSVPK